MSQILVKEITWEPRQLILWSCTRVSCTIDNNKNSTNSHNDKLFIIIMIVTLIIE